MKKYFFACAATFMLLMTGLHVRAADNAAGAGPITPPAGSRAEQPATNAAPERADKKADDAEKKAAKKKAAGKNSKKKQSGTTQADRDAAAAATARITNQTRSGAKAQSSRATAGAVSGNEPAEVGSVSATAAGELRDAGAATPSGAIAPVRTAARGGQLADAAPAPGGNPKSQEELETLRQTTLNLIKLLVDSGIVTQDKADVLIQQAKRTAAETVAAQTQAESKVVRVPYVPQFVRDEIRQEIKDEVVAQAKQEGWAQPNAIPDWVGRIRLNGDFRLRYQGNYLSPQNDPAKAGIVDIQNTNAGTGLALLNTTKNFDYLRYQLRLGLDARITDNIMVGTRLASGNTGNPVSLNQTLGNSFNKNSVVIDLAYVRADPYDWLTLTGGRMPSPWFSTDLLWYDQLNFDGLAASVRTPLPAASKGTFTVGAFPVETIDCTSAVSVGTCGNDKWLYAAQAVFETALRSNTTFKLGLAYYGWQNYEGRFNDPMVNPADRTFIPKFAQKGNTYFNVVTDNSGKPLYGLASRFKDVDLVAQIDLAHWDPVHVVLTGDFVKNIGYDRNEIFTRTGGLIDQQPRTNAWFARVSVGHPVVQKWGDWQVYAGYKYVERDSMVDGYNDPDFHFGGTDAKGYLVGMVYGLGTHAYTRLRWLSANSIDGTPFAWDVLQLDFIAAF